MYRSRCFLKKSTLLSARSHSVTPGTRNFVPDTFRSKHGRFMSSKPKLKSSSLNWGYSTAAGLLFGCAATVGATVFVAKRSESFRDVVQTALPFTKPPLRYFIDSPELPPELPSFLRKVDDVKVGSGAEEGDHLIVNIVDQPFPAAIDYELGNVPHDDDLKEGETDVDIISVTDITPVDEGGVDAVVEVEENVLPVSEELSVEEILTEEIAMPAEEGFVFSVVEELPVEDSVVVEDVVAEELSAEVAIVEDVIPVFDEEAVPEAAVAYENVFVDSFGVTPLSMDYHEVEEGTLLSIESLTTVLTSEYENLQIVIHDAITTKSSGAGMLQGYITQFGRALLVHKEDPAYESVWESVSHLECAVEQSFELVKLKEDEIASQVDCITKLIAAIRNFGTSDLADMAAELISSAGEHLLSCETEIETATKKLNFLVSYQEILKSSSKLVQMELEAFTPDLIQLLNITPYSGGVDELSTEDTLLLFSLLRRDLVYAEGQKKEEELQKEFEASIEKQKEDLSKEAEGNLKMEIEKVVAIKDSELELKVVELDELHENHLKEELQIQYKASQQELESAVTAQKEELDSLFTSEMNAKLSKQDEEHSSEIQKNISYLNGIKSKVGDVLDIGEKQRLCQSLSVAAQALNNALGTLEGGRTKNFIFEIPMIMQIPDETVNAIVTSLPKAAIDSGVVPEKVLLQHFTDVKYNCKKVAMVKDESESFVAYTLSYLKSLLVITRFYQCGISGEIDPQSLGPYEILEKADFYIQKGDLVQAAKFMSQLKGVPGKMCADWLKEVRLLLETKQLADFLTAYAGSLISGFE